MPLRHPRGLAAAAGPICHDQLVLLEGVVAGTEPTRGPQVSSQLGFSQLCWQYLLHLWLRKKAAMPAGPQSVRPNSPPRRLWIAG